MALEAALSYPALLKARPATTGNRVWQWTESSVGMIVNLVILKRVSSPKRLNVRVESPALDPRQQQLLHTPVLAANMPHDFYEYGYMSELYSLYKHRAQSIDWFFRGAFWHAAHHCQS